MDVFVAVTTLVFAGVAALIHLRVSRVKSANRPPGLLVLDASYTLDQIRDRGLEYALKSSECDGLFGQVWTVHPLVGAEEGQGVAQRIRVSTIDSVHTYIEVSVTSGRGSTSTPRTSFVVSQVRLIRHLRRLIETGAISMIRSTDPYYLGLLGYLVARCARLPFVVRVRSNGDLRYESTGLVGYPRLIPYYWLEVRILEFVVSRADQLFAPSIDNLEFAVGHGAPRDRISVVPYGSLLSPEHFGDPKDRRSIREEFGIGDRPLITTVCRLEPEKFIADVVEVLTVVRSVVPDVVCVISGDGSLRGQLLELAERHGHTDALVLVGNRPQQWVAELLADADVILAFIIGRALVESALSATPIVAYDCEWHTEFITEGVTGLLVPSRDSAAMAEGALTLLSDSSRAAKIGLQARTHVLEVMSPAVVTQLERELLVTRFPLVLNSESRSPSASST